jgi:hypothetical protein
MFAVRAYQYLSSFKVKVSKGRRVVQILEMFRLLGFALRLDFSDGDLDLNSRLDGNGSLK